MPPYSSAAAFLLSSSVRNRKKGFRALLCNSSRPFLLEDGEHKSGLAGQDLESKKPYDSDHSTHSDFPDRKRNSIIENLAWPKALGAGNSTGATERDSVDR
jgi:hypothetical protein